MRTLIEIMAGLLIFALGFYVGVVFEREAGREIEEHEGPHDDPGYRFGGHDHDDDSDRA